MNDKYQRTTAATRKAAKQVRYLHFSIAPGGIGNTMNLGRNKAKRAKRARAKALTS
jgi:hypothetical protein